MRVREISKKMFTSSEKQEVRRAIIDAAITNGCKNMLTLAGPMGADAKMFATSLKGARVVSIETRASVFERQQLEMANHKNIICLNADVSDFLDNGIKYFHKFDCVFLDYNCIYRKEVEHDMQSLFGGGRFTRDGVFGITIVKGRDYLHNHIIGTRLLKGVCCNDVSAYFSDRQGCIRTTVYQIARDFGIDLTDILCKSYRNDDKKGVTMMAFIFKTTNRRKNG